VTGGETTTRVLIIDGDNVRRGMLACSLPAARFSLEFAKSLERGLDLLNRTHPAVVIIGRDSSSRDLCQRVRSLPAGMTCTLVLMDERFRDEAIGELEAESVGADTFLPFPFEASLLEKRLRTKTRDEARQETRTQSEESFPVPFTPDTSPALQAHPEEAIEAAWESFRQRVRSFHQNLDSLDYYQLLQIPPNASTGAIKDAYFRCSMEFHPDRFMQLSDEDLRAQIYEVYKRMSEAFKVLINPLLRSQYDGMLASPVQGRNRRYLERHPPIASADEPTMAASSQGGKRYLHLALLAEEEGNLRSARMYLNLALQCEPDNLELRSRLDGITSRMER
jgi:DnaJ-domain-containing protein 1